MFDPASIRRQQAMTALGQVGSGLLGFAAGDPRALQSGMAAAAQATDPAVMEQARMRQEMLRLAQQKQQQEVQARQQEMQRQQALQAAIPTLAEESGLPAEMLSIDPGAAMKAVMKARLDRTKMTPFDAFMSGDPAARAAAEQWRQMGRPPGASVNIAPGAFNFARPQVELAADKKFGETIGTMLGETAVSAPRQIAQQQKYRVAENLLGDLEKEGMIGAFGPEKAQFAKYAPIFARAAGIDPDQVANYEQFSSIVNQDVLQYIGAEQGGIPASGFSDRDMNMVKRMAMNTRDEPEALRAKLAIARHMGDAKQDMLRYIGDARRKGESTEAAYFDWKDKYSAQDRIMNDPAVKAFMGAPTTKPATEGRESVDDLLDMYAPVK